MNYFIQFLIVFDLICFGVYFGGDIVCTALAKVRKKPGQKDPYEIEVEDEPAEPPLSIDASVICSAARSTILSETNFCPAGRRRFPP